MELRVNDYVRTKRGLIARILKINSTGSITCDRNVYWGAGNYNSKKVLCDLTQIIKSSPNIIDLIEVGDYVNGHKVLDIAQAPIRALYLEDISQTGALIPVCDYQIKSIVTKEQFKNMEYKVGE